ncbi:flavocytochrome c, partial [Acinetobacter baumannii]|nr:flavocytochrome c [Acinetobacter baumannii]
FIDDYGLAFPGAIGIDNDEKIAGLAKIAEAIKAEGSKAILQIYHGGRMVDPQLIGGRQPVAPSAIAAPREGAAMPRALGGEEVEGRIAKFGDGVRRAILAGFDGVEIHGANTYLIQQFYSPNSNQRDDEWGGSRDNRARFPLAVLDITHKMARQYADDA